MAVKTPWTRRFSKFADWSAAAFGGHIAFLISLVAIAAWAVIGLFVGFFTVWYQFLLNTTLSVLTWLLVILVQHSTARETAAIMLKLDELILSTDKARNAMINVESLTAEDLAELKIQTEELAKRAIHDHGLIEDYGE